ncbi:MAG: MMPL family transporter [Actinobacteria bacterium]|nr:MMPL family transporter [Actinomycetota bacterium]
MARGPETVATASARRPWTTIIVWLIALVGAGVLSSMLLGDALTSEITFTNYPDSIKALELAEEVRGAQEDVEFVVIRSDGRTVEDPTYVAYVEELQSALAGSPAVVSVGSYLTEDGPVSDSGIAALMPVVLAGDEGDEFFANAETIAEVVGSVDSPDGFETHIAGQATMNNDFNHIAEQDLRTGETIGIGVALVVLVFVFGSVVAGLVPIILAVVAIGVAMGLAALLGQATDLSFFITNMITMIGLAVGIDYSLFIVSRYREERRNGFAKLEAIGRSAATATRAVVFSGLTVVLALIGMLILPNTLFRSLGLGAILVVVAAVVASLTLLPAILSLMGDRIESLRVRRRGSVETESRFWDRVTRLVMARPVVSLLLSAGLLLLAASSFQSINTGLAGVSTLPSETDSAKAFAILTDEFAGGLTSPVEIAIEGPEAMITAAAVESAIAADGGFGPSQIDPASDETVAILSVQLLGDVSSVESMDTVRRLRSEIIPAVADSGVFVGGQTAITVDFIAQTDDYTPIVFAVVLGLSFLLLMLAFRSVVIPPKAIIMNLLSVGAAYGLIVVFFQAGVGPEWVKDLSSGLGFSQVEVIENWLPLMLFSVLFGLSMDYHVFLLSRIKERFDQTGDNTESVAYGLRKTGALITGAAVIMVAVFAGFAAGSLVSFQQMGFGLAVAVLFDATIVRTVLVPASMKLLGRWNWYFPRWLEWVPNISVEGHLDETPPVTTDPEPVVA